MVWMWWAVTYKGKAVHRLAGKNPKAVRLPLLKYAT